MQDSGAFQEDTPDWFWHESVDLDHTLWKQIQLDHLHAQQKNIH